MSEVWYKGYRVRGKGRIVRGGDGPQRILSDGPFGIAGEDWSWDWGRAPGGLEFTAARLLADHLGYPVTEGQRDDFARQVVANLPETWWLLTGDDIQDWLDHRPLALGERTEPAAEAEGGAL